MLGRLMSELKLRPLEEGTQDAGLKARRYKDKTYREVWDNGGMWLCGKTC